ncbi:unnamed protein product [Medioppia subpectinata]|uniref:WD repeat-containing protein 54 beta-propeller domain-containing protein n=1 Tax=Medioppia subpectinata TaxID=1979941 RepID=A0A7R9Q3C4_9ACAR|nr:unnamed protein product [Medioppia subpectinata]CAG2111156.1 unnamed protein product [Medioppia subpectinata]
MCKPRVANAAKPEVTDHMKPITDLVSNEKNILVSCDDSGKIWVWDYIDSRLQQTVSFEGYNGFSCNCLAFYKKYVLAGYGSGHLRVFDINSKLLISEISGHSKWVTAIDVAPDTDRVSHEFSQNIANHMLFGGVFLDKSGNSFCVSGYDSLELHYFSQ